MAEDNGNEYPFPSIIGGPFTQVYSEYTNKERRYIHDLISRAVEIMNYNRPNIKQKRELKAIRWVLNELKEVQAAD